MWASCAKMAEQIDIVFGAEVPGEPRNIVDRSLILHGDGGGLMQPLPNYFGKGANCPVHISGNNQRL